MYRSEYEKWRKSAALTPEEQAELAAIEGDNQEIEERFYAPLSFGTAGLRGIMGTGLARMNIHVVRHATQGFAQVILEQGEAAAQKGVVIACDSRHNSEIYAREAAALLAANGIYVRLFSQMRPTPQLSFAIRHYGATAGINITASHNPKAYNGYKVYWSDGAQLPPPFAAKVAERMGDIDIFTGIKTMDYETAVTQGKITLLGKETDEAFLACVMGESLGRDYVGQTAEHFKLVYTPLHGTGGPLVLEALKRLGVRHVLPVYAQLNPDGEFPTVKSPNPEDPAGFQLALEIARDHSADLIIATDPDADRVGTMVRHEGAYLMISGNQMGVLLLHYIITARKRDGNLPENAAFLKSIVTTEMARAVAERHGVAAYNTFTGFKFIAEKMADLGAEKTVIFAYEESYGYMVGDFVRDKDAITASMLIAEMTAWYKTRGMTLIDGLEELYRDLGYYYGEEVVNLSMPGYHGLQKMAELMANLRENPPTEIGGQAVITRRDYLSGKRLEEDGKEAEMALKGSNVLSFTLADGTTFIVRPSGTEPKVKVYVLARGENRAACEETIRRCLSYANQLTADIA